jgi:hypothetical protein
MEPTEAKGLELAPPSGYKSFVWQGTLVARDRRGNKSGCEADCENQTRTFFIKHRDNPPINVGLVSAPMRRLELRDFNCQGLDRPKFVPASRLRQPERPMPADAQAAAADAENLSGKWIQRSTMNLPV